MSEMVERVARALYQDTWELVSTYPATRARAIEQARWAIEAIRTPSFEMVRAAATRARVSESTADLIWTTMIDALLEGK